MNFVSDASLVLYLPLYEPDGNSFISRDVYGCVCTVNGAAWKPRGRLFDGVDDKIALPAAVYQAFGNTDDFTIEAWVRKDVSTGGYMISHSKITTHQPSIWMHASGMKVRQTTNATSNDVTYTLSDGWHHLVLVWKASNHTLYGYVDGELAGSDGTNALTFARTDFGSGNIGYLVNSGPYNNMVGEVREYRRALLPQEIQRNYLATKWRYR